MFATANSEHFQRCRARSQVSYAAIVRRAFRVWLVLGCASLPFCPVRAQPERPSADSPAARAEREFHAAFERFEKAPEDVEVCWQFGRACFDWADFATDDEARASVARRGISACRAALDTDPKSVAAHYYLGLNLGQLARTKRFGALRLLREMEVAWKTAVELDPEFDYAGPHRSLGLLYLDAPHWPISIGSRSEAREHLEKAVALSPTYPDNRLCLLEAYLEWGRKQEVREQLTAVQGVLDAARKRFSGKAWAASWLDWEQRWRTIRTKAYAPVKPVESPRNKR